MEKQAPCNKDIAEKHDTQVIDDDDDIDTRTTIYQSTELTDKTKLCEYPVGSINSVTVCYYDYATLKPGVFLNDIMIDFYLTYLHYTSLSNEKRSLVHIFSTMFYKRLISTPSQTNIQAIPSYETDPNTSEAEKRHCRVKGWTKNCDLFEKVLLVIPICENSHWYLVIVVRPGNLVG